MSEPGVRCFGEEVFAALEVWQKNNRCVLTLAEVLPDGGSGARLALCYHTGDARHPVHKLLLKLCAPEEGAVDEPHDLEAAWSCGPAYSRGAEPFVFPDRRLVRQEYPPLRIGDTWLMFLRIAIDGRRGYELSPLDRMTSPDARRQVAAAVIRSVLTEWNPDPRADHRMTGIGFLRNALGHRADSGALNAAAARLLGGDAGRPWIRVTGHEDRLPNPFLLSEHSVLNGLKPPTVSLGRAHYDLHPGNILVETKPELVPEEHRLVDLSRFTPAGVLTRDPVHLMLCLVSDFLEHLSERSRQELIEVLVSDWAKKPDMGMLPGALASTLTSLMSAPDSWRSYRGRDYTLTDWHPQYLLALQAGALMFVTRDRWAAEHRWFLHLAARACAAFVQVARPVTEPQEAEHDRPSGTRHGAAPQPALAEVQRPPAEAQPAAPAAAEDEPTHSEWLDALLAFPDLHRLDYRFDLLQLMGQHLRLPSAFEVESRSSTRPHLLQIVMKCSRYDSQGRAFGALYNSMTELVPYDRALERLRELVARTAGGWQDN
ncbi:hypothetical protein ACFYNL_19290 [Streptomyces sp. NPDC007808]|uniref:effector-associated domain 2-containing protein n=1 Tax=Streptomyces sp. NPDC007808 TaxID=3364779 RepID=UPI00368FBB96